MKKRTLYAIVAWLIISWSFASRVRILSLSPLDAEWKVFVECRTTVVIGCTDLLEAIVCLAPVLFVLARAALARQRAYPRRRRALAVRIRAFARHTELPVWNIVALFGVLAIVYCVMTFMPHRNVAPRYSSGPATTAAPLGRKPPPTNGVPLLLPLAEDHFRLRRKFRGSCRGPTAPNRAPCIAGCAADAAALPVPPTSAKPICKNFWHKRFASASECRAAMHVARARIRTYLCAASGPCAASGSAASSEAPRAAQAGCERRGTRGLVTTGGLKTIWGSVGLHFDRFNSTLPVDIFVDNALQLNACSIQLKEKKWHLARCHILDRSLKAFKARHSDLPLPSTVHTATHAGNKKYELKLLAILQSCFNEVLFLDADAAPLMDLAPLFDTCDFKEAGALFWPDLWGHACSVHKWAGERAMVGQSAWPEHIMWELLAPFGVKWKPRWSHGQEFESGQLLVDKQRHMHPLLIALAFCTDQFIQKVIFGDKDTFKFAWLTAGHNYTLVRSLPSMFLRPAEDTDGSGKLLDKPPTTGTLNRIFHFQSWENTPIIMHQMKTDSFRGGRARAASHALRTEPVPLVQESSASADPDTYSYCPTHASYGAYDFNGLKKDTHRPHHPHFLEPELLNSLSEWMAIAN